MSLILVCGGRDYDNKERVDYILSRLSRNPQYDQLVFIQGGARGADRLAKEWAEAHGFEVITIMAEWDEYGKRAGYLRNKAMLDFGPPDLVIAFLGGRGTADMLRQSRSLGITVVEV